MNCSLKHVFVWLRSVCALIFGAAIEMPLAYADATVTATGYVFCYDGVTGSEHPLVGARVELMDSDCLGSEVCDDEMSTGHVGVGGFFNVQGRAGDPFGGDPDVYVRIVLNDDAGVRLTDEIGVSRSLSTSQHDHDNTSHGTTIDFGKLTFGSGVGSGESEKCAVWREVQEAYVEYLSLSLMRTPPPAGYIDIQYWSAIFHGTPWTNTDTIHWPIRYGSSSARHEFGHSIRHAADGSGAHFTNDVLRFRYARNHDPCTPLSNAQPGELLQSIIGYNFNEGWANYWEGNTSGCAGAHPETVIMEFDEGVVALYLQAIQTGHTWSRADMVNVLIANPGGIHSFDEFAAHLPPLVASSAHALVQPARVQIGAVASAVRRPAYSAADRRRVLDQFLEQLRAGLAVRRQAVASQRAK